MSYISEVLREKTDFLAGDGIEEKMIAVAENELGTRFDKEYREYLIEFGTAAYDGHELTGLTDSLRTNVVSVTREERDSNPAVPQEYYVIERTDIESIVIWQAPDGEIFYSSPNTAPVSLCESFSEYLKR